MNRTWFNSSDYGQQTCQDYEISEKLFSSDFDQDTLCPELSNLILSVLWKIRLNNDEFHLKLNHIDKTITFRILTDIKDPKF